MITNNSENGSSFNSPVQSTEPSLQASSAKSKIGLIILFTAIVATGFGWLIGYYAKFGQSLNEYIVNTEEQPQTALEITETSEPLSETQTKTTSTTKELGFAPTLNPLLNQPGWATYTNQFARFRVNVPEYMEAYETIWIESPESTSPEINQQTSLQGVLLLSDDTGEFQIGYGIPFMSGVGGGCDQDYTTEVFSGRPFSVCRSETGVNMTSTPDSNSPNEYSIFITTDTTLEGSRFQEILDSFLLL